jgi:uncharacterized protein (DUF2062 family)
LLLRTALRRLLAIDDPPERTALAFSVGIFIAFSPFLGLHTILATLVAFVFRFNKVAIYTGTFLNNPFLTLAPIIVGSYALGAFLMGRPIRIPKEGVDLLKNHSILSTDYYGRIFVHARNILEPFALGGMVLSVVCSLLAYPLTLRALRFYRRRRGHIQD